MVIFFGSFVTIYLFIYFQLSFKYLKKRPLIFTEFNTAPQVPKMFSKLKTQQGLEALYQILRRAPKRAWAGRLCAAILKL